MDKWTREATKSPQAAREHLVRDGFYTKDGKLTPAYGGKAKPQK
jgi:hypothetical protein